MATDTTLWGRALDGGGFVGIAVALVVIAAIAFSKAVVIPALRILREMTENCTRAASDNNEAAGKHREAASDLKGTARILESLIKNRTGGHQ